MAGWEENGFTEKEENRIREFLEDDMVYDLLCRLIDTEKNFNVLEKKPDGNFYNEATNLLVAKGGVIALEQLKLKLKCYRPTESL